MNYDEKTISELVELARQEVSAISECLDVLDAVPHSTRSEEAIQEALSTLDTIMHSIWAIQNPELANLDV
jgi:enoyl-[acyl-carrier-protein] reductase (NADH)